MAEKHLTCVDCPSNACGKPGATLPSFCLGKGFSLLDTPELVASMEEQRNARIYRSAAHSAHVGHSWKLDRLHETILFAQGYGAEKIGVASCISCAAEARFAVKELREAGFTVVGAICKVGCLTCEQTGVPLEARSPETRLCNPIYQAQLLNAERTDLNVVIGLCVGHDALFLKYADAPCTVLATKDFKFGKDNAPCLQEASAFAN